MQNNKSLRSLQEELDDSVTKAKELGAIPEVGDKDDVDVSDGVSTTKPAADAEAEDLETLKMLADSYREVTGQALPPNMTVEQAYKELKMRAMAAWGGEIEMLSAPSEDSINAESNAPEDREERGLKRLAKGFKKARVSTPANITFPACTQLCALTQQICSLCHTPPSPSPSTSVDVARGRRRDQRVAPQRRRLGSVHA